MTHKQLTEVGRITRAVARHYGFTVAEIDSHKRTFELSWARWCCIVIAHYDVGVSRRGIAGIFNRTQSSIHCVLRKHSVLIEEPKLRKEWEEPRDGLKLQREKARVE